MIHKLHGWVRRAVGFSPLVSPLLVVPTAPDWTPEDATRWNQFLRTPTGQSLWQRARAREAALCVQACAGRHDPKVASGFSFTLNWLENMANAESISSAADANAATTADDQLAEGQPANEFSYA